jgi:hypothetical protein
MTQFIISTPGTNPSNSQPEIQAALDAVALAGGGEVFISSGTYLIGATLSIGNNTHLRMEQDTVLLRNFSNNGPPLLTNKLPTMGTIENRNIRVSGGTIATRNDAHEGKQIAFERVNYLTIDHVHIENVRRNWMIAIGQCNDVVVSNIVTTFTPPTAPLQIQNEDGLHFTGGSRIAVTNCVIHSGDDALSITQEGFANILDMSDIVVSNCTLISDESNCLRVWVSNQAGTAKTIRRVRVANCIGRVGLPALKSGHGIEIADTEGESGRLTDIEVDGFWMDCTNNGGYPVILSGVSRVRLQSVTAWHPGTAIKVDDCTDVELRDCIVDTPWGVAAQCLLVGLNLPCTNFRLIGGKYLNAPNHAVAVGASLHVSKFQVLGVNISNAALHGLIVRGQGGLVSGNVIDNCGQHGIYETGLSAANSFIGNVVTNTGMAPLSLSSTANSYAIRNTTNPGQGIVDTGGFRQTIDGWYFDNVPANSSAFVELPRFALQGGVAAVAGRFRAARKGSITAVVVTSTVNVTAGSLGVLVYRNIGPAGSITPGDIIAVGLAATLNTTVGQTQRHAVTAAEQVHEFNAGDEIFLALASSTLTPNNVCIRCAIEIED